MPIHIYYVYQYAQCISISSPHWILDATTAIPKPTKVLGFYWGWQSFHWPLLSCRNPQIFLGEVARQLEVGLLKLIRMGRHRFAWVTTIIYNAFDRVKEIHCFLSSWHMII